MLIVVGLLIINLIYRHNHRHTEVLAKLLIKFLSFNIFRLMLRHFYFNFPPGKFDYLSLNIFAIFSDTNLENKTSNHLTCKFNTTLSTDQRCGLYHHWKVYYCKIIIMHIIHNNIIPQRMHLLCNTYRNRYSMYWHVRKLSNCLGSYYHHMVEGK